MFTVVIQLNRVIGNFRYTVDPSNISVRECDISITDYNIDYSEYLAISPKPGFIGKYALKSLH